MASGSPVFNSRRNWMLLGKLIIPIDMTDMVEKETEKWVAQSHMEDP